MGSSVRVFILLAVAAQLAGSTVWAMEKKSLVIGIDGMGFGSQGFIPADTPNMDRLISGNWSLGYHGAFSADAFAGGVIGTATQQQTSSGPGWSTILTGVWKDQHGVNDNGASFTAGDFLSNPPYLGTLRERDSTIWTGSYVWWYPTDDLIISSLDRDEIPNNEVNFHNWYQSSYGLFQDGGDQFVADDAVAGIENLADDVPAAIFVAFDTVDHWGHVGGSSSEGYREAIERTDARVGELLAAATNRTNFANEDWQIVITADHGHTAIGGHGSQSSLERTIPLIVASQSVVQGSAGPAADGIPVSHADVAPTVLDHFGMAIPSRYSGASRAAGVLPDFDADGAIDSHDLAIWQCGFGRVFRNSPLHSDGNADADLDVDGHDFLTWQRHVTVASTTAVPEPACAALLAVAMLGMLLRGR